MIIRSALNNYGKQKQGNRYEISLKLYFTYIYILGGRILYDSLVENLPIPSASSILRHISSTATPLVEGTLRISELVHFLKIRRLPRLLWLSEDATRIVDRVEYDSQTNQLVGFVLPFGSNGMPIPCSFLATSAKEMENHFTNNTVASSLYTIMAQPLQNGAPCFCLLVFGTDNKFDTHHVVNRWEYTVRKLEEQGITVVGFSSDGDSRLMKSMRIKTNLGLKNPDFTVLGQNINMLEFHANIKPRYVCTQDTVHLGCKLIARLLKPSIIMPVGNSVVTVGHLQILINSVSKDKHLLTQSNLNTKDKMNFTSVEKICNPRIPLLLKNHVPGSEGTQEYLTVVYYTINSYLNSELDIPSRIYCIWYSVFFLRLWRAWLRNKSEYSVTENGITANAYLCTEINAHSLVNVIFYLQEKGSIENFMPWQYGSQQCESFFRNLRSTSTTCSTVVNCTLLEAIHRHLRLQLQADISVFDFKSEGENIHFPRTRHLNASYETQNEKMSLGSLPIDDNSDFPNLKTIEKVLKIAKKDAFNKISKLGMHVNIEEANQIQISNVRNNIEECDNVENSDENARDEVNELNNCDTENLLQDLMTLSKITGEIELPDHSNKKIELNVNSPFTVVRDSKGKEYVVRKSSICWFLRTKNSKLSADRLIRVQESEFKKNKNRPSSEKTDLVVTSKEIIIGDWCLFKQEQSKKCLIGLVLGFAYHEEKTWRAIEYSNTYANVHGNTKSVGVLCQWYEVDDRDFIVPLELIAKGSNHGYINIKKYVLTIPPPTSTLSGLSLTLNVLSLIKSKLK